MNAQPAAGFEDFLLVREHWCLLGRSLGLGLR
jgi:hypothetical protein